jgi:hypothetical protein
VAAFTRAASAAGRRRAADDQVAARISPRRTVRVVPELPDPDEGLVRRAVHRWRFESVALEAPD